MERTLKTLLAFGVYAALTTPLIVSTNTFFPFVVGKTLAFRVIVELMFPVWILWLVAYWRKGALAEYFRTHWLTAFVLAYFGVLMLATLFSITPYRSFWSNAERMEGLFTLLNFLLFFLMVSSTFRDEKPQWSRFLAWSVFVSVAVAFVAYLQWFQVPFVFMSRDRPESTLGNSSYLSIYLLFHIVFAILLASEAQKARWRALFLLIVLAEGWMVIVSGTRGVFFAIAMTLAAGLAATFFSRPLRPIRPLALALLILLVVAGMALFVGRETALIRSSPTLARAAAIFRFGDDPALRSRIVNWRTALEAFRERPILGWGPEMYSAAFYTHIDPAYFGDSDEIFDRPHNKLIEVLTLTGLAGLLTYLAIFLQAGSYLWCNVSFSQSNLSPQTGRSFHPLQALRLLYPIREPLLLGGLLIAYFIQNLFIFDHPSSYLLFFLTLGYLEAQGFSPISNRRMPPTDLRHRTFRPNDAMRHGLSIRRSSFTLAMMISVLASLYFLTVNLAHWRQTRAMANLVLPTSLQDGTVIFADLAQRPSPFLVEAVLRFQQFLPRQAKRDERDDRFLRALEEGIRAARAAWQQDPYDMRTPLTLSSLLVAHYQLTRDVRSFEEAQNTLERAHSTAPNFLSIQYQLAYVAAVGGNPERARAYVEEALKKSPQARRAYWFRGQIELLERDYVAARASLEHAFRLGYREHHNDPSALVSLVHLYTELGESKRARIYELLPQLPVISLRPEVNKALAYLEQKEYGKVREVLVRLRSRLSQLAPVAPELAQQYERAVDAILAALPPE